MLRHRKSLSYLNESTPTMLDKVYDAADELIDALEDLPLDPKQIEFRINQITRAIERGMDTRDTDIVRKIALHLDGDKDVADLAVKYADWVYSVVDEVEGALAMTFGYRQDKNM